MSSSALFRLAGASLVASAGLLAAWNTGLHAEQLAAPMREPGRVARVDNRLVADFVVRHRRFDDGGVAIGPSSEVSYRLVREMRGGRWVTSMDVHAPGITVMYPDGPRRLPNPFAAVRVEQPDGPDGQVWLVGADGRRRMMPDAKALEELGEKLAASTRSAGRQAVASGTTQRPPDVPARARAGQPSVNVEVFAEPGRLEERRDRLARSFGQVRGRLRGLDKYVRDDGSGHIEVLVDPETALPAEIRSASPSGDQSFTELRYEVKAGRGHVRRLMRSEQKLAGVPGTNVTEVELTRLAVGDEVEP